MLMSLAAEVSSLVFTVSYGKQWSFLGRPTTKSRKLENGEIASGQSQEKIKRSSRKFSQEIKSLKKGLIQNKIKGFTQTISFFCRNTWACCSKGVQWPGMDMWQETVTTYSNRWLWIAWDVFIYTVSMDGLHEQFCYQFCSLKFFKIVTIIVSSFPISFPFCLPNFPPVAMTFWPIYLLLG